MSGKEDVKMSPAEQELLEQQFSKDLENAKEEKLRAELSIKEHETMLKEFEELQPMLEKYVGKISPGLIKKLEPEYAYEQDDEYWVLMAQVQKIEWLQKYFSNKDRSIKSMKDTVKAKKEHLESLNEKISRMEEGD